jgi:26S proteasome regulatory subunit N3
MSSLCCVKHRCCSGLCNCLVCYCSFLHGRLRTCVLRGDHEGQATLINLLLRNYINHNLYSQAEKLVLQTHFPDNVSNNEGARHLYYLGRSRLSVIVNFISLKVRLTVAKLIYCALWLIASKVKVAYECVCVREGRLKAIQLTYSEAHRHLLQAMRKAPQHSAVGFKQTVQKLAVTVELLLGDIPDRAIFRQPAMKKALQPYLLLTQGM